MKNDGKKILSFLTLLLALLLLTGRVMAQTSCDSTCDESDRDCLKKLEELCREKVITLQSQANTLKNQIAQFDTQIYLATLSIKETEEKILLLGGRIDQLEGSLTTLSDAFSLRASETYKMQRLEDPFIFLITSSDLLQMVQRFFYLKKIQEADRNLLVRLQEAQDVYKDEKTDQEVLQEELEDQKQVLGAQKAAKADLLAVTKNDEDRYQKLLSQAKSQLDKFRRFTTGQGGASILSGQTKCNSWGCYYNQRDSQWGNMFLGGTNYLMKDSGCFITSVAMLASHAGKHIGPGDIAQLSAAVTSGGDLKWSFSVNGVGVSINWASKNELDQKLDSGPVIAGLYSGPDHFIVILRKEGDNYIMHDPFLENGGEKPLTDQYSVSDITSLRLVTFN